MNIKIDSDFDGGNIEIVDLRDAASVDLRIRSDHNSEFAQWFNFKVSAIPGSELVINIINAGETTFGGWEGYHPVVSTDGQIWRRQAATFDGMHLSIPIVLEEGQIQIAYFVPYPLRQHQILIDRCTENACVTYRNAGPTVDGRSLDILRITRSRSPKYVFWVTARQHPGEVMAEWWMEGFLERLLDEHCEIASDLLEEAIVFVIPNMNPDGSARGHIRSNAASIDLNRAWAAPDKKRCPEVFAVRNIMAQTSPDLCLDIHGVEDMRHCFVVPPDGHAGRHRYVRDVLEIFNSRLLSLNPDFQTECGFTATVPVEFGIGTNYQAETFGCVAMTLEMPFADTTHTPDPSFGWSPKRSMRMGHDCLEALAALTPYLQKAPL